MEAHKKELRRYLLGQLDESDQERLEIQLLSNPEFVEEFDKVVDEITDEYVTGELKLGERERVEQYFLKARQRRDKADFASAFLTYASGSAGGKREAPESVQVRETGWHEKLLAFWTHQGLATRVAAAMVTILVVAGIAFLLFSGPSRSLTFTTIELAITHADRAESVSTQRVRLSPEIDALRIRLRLPEGLPASKNYRAESVDENSVKRELEITAQDEQAITVIAPASDLTSGRYGIQLTSINGDGAEQRIPGTYRFEIETADSPK